MIGIFYGRGLLREDDAVHIQIAVQFRDHIHEFSNGRNQNALAVFLAIALHANEGGWAWPGRALLRRETGIRTEWAITKALEHLRAMRIEGKRVLAHYRELDPDTHRYGRSAYLLWPDDSPGDRPRGLRNLVEFDPGADQDAGTDAADEDGVIQDGGGAVECQNGAEAVHADFERIMGVTVEPAERKARSADEIMAAGREAAERVLARAANVEPWERWGINSDVIARYGREDVPRGAVQRLGYGLETICGLRPAWGDYKEVKGWVNGLVKLYQTAGGDLDLVLAAIKTAVKVNEARDLGDRIALTSPYSFTHAVRDEIVRRHAGRDAGQRLETIR